MNVSLSLNGIEHAYDRWLDADPTAVSPLAFEFVHATAERAVVDTLGNTSALGPISGGTLVMVHGTALARGHERRCIFGVGVVNATLAALGDGNVLRCIAPSAADAGGLGLASSGGVVPLRLSLNGRDEDFATPPLEYRYYVPPIVSSIHPPTASAAGGTSLTLRGSGFGGASALLRCRFGGVVESAEPLAADDQHHLLHAVRLHLRRRARGHGRRLLRARRCPPPTQRQPRAHTLERVRCRGYGRLCGASGRALRRRGAPRALV